jgi:cell cycle checkpoint protein
MELDFDILEWLNPINEQTLFNTSTDTRHDNEDHLSNSSSTYTTSITTKFIEFLSSARKTNSLTFSSSIPDHTHHPYSSSPSKSHSNISSNALSNRKRIILIEDLPNVSHPTVRKTVHDSLRQLAFSNRTMFPLVMIVTDTIAHRDFMSESGNFGGVGSGDGIANLRTLVPVDVLHSPVCGTIT